MKSVCFLSKTEYDWNENNRIISVELSHTLIHTHTNTLWFTRFFSILFRLADICRLTSLFLGHSIDIHSIFSSNWYCCCIEQLNQSKHKNRLDLFLFRLLCSLNEHLTFRSSMQTIWFSHVQWKIYGVFIGTCKCSSNFGSIEKGKKHTRHYFVISFIVTLSAN